MEYDEYVDEFGDNGDLDVKDVKDIQEYQANKNFIFNKESGGLNIDRIEPDLNPKVKYFKVYCDKYSYFKEEFMSEEYSFIKRLSVIYEICNRDKYYFYRRFIIFDPINKNYFIPDNNYDINDYIYALNMKITKK